MVNDVNFDYIQFTSSGKNIFVALYLYYTYFDICYFLVSSHCGILKDMTKLTRGSLTRGQLSKNG